MTRRKPRAFSRDDYLGIRMLRSDKARLTSVASSMRRDTSNLALELICRGLAECEIDIARHRAREQA